MSTRPTGRIWALFVDRPILTLMLTIGVLLVGVIALFKVPLRFLPDGFASNQVNLWIPIPRSMAPREVEDQVTRPFEELLRSIHGLRSVSSWSSAGNVRVNVELDQGLDPVIAAAEVRDRAQRARLVWPKEVDRWFTWREDSSSLPLAFFQILAPKKNTEWDFLIDDIVRPRLESVDGVGRVELWGLLDETIRIWFDRDKLRAHSINFRQVLERLATDNFTQPVGEVDDGRQRMLVRVDGKFRSTSEIEDWPVRPGLAIKDLATVERVPTVRDNLARYEGKYAYGGMIRMTAGANPVDASEALAKGCAELKLDPHLAGIEFYFEFDQGRFIRQSLDTLVWSGIEGGLLALLVLWLFLRNLRLTLITGLSIPLSMLVVGGWLYFTGDSLNILTMAGMTIAVGMVVDNAVVVLENIRRQRQEGVPLREACVGGAAEIGLAVTLATLTSVVVFLPLVFMGGNTNSRVLLGAVGIPLSVSLLASLVVALWLLPSGVRALGGVGEAGAGFAERVAKRLAFLSVTAWLTRINAALLRFSLRGFWRRVLATVVLVLVLATMAMPIKWMDFSTSESGPFRGSDISMRMDIERGLTLRDVEREVMLYEDFVNAHRDEWGIAAVSTRFSRMNARVDVRLAKGTPAKRIGEIRKKVEADWPRRPGIKTSLRDTGSSGGGGGGGEEKDQRNFVLRLFGRDSETLSDIALLVRHELEQLEGVESIDAGQLDRNEEVVVHVDRERGQDLGVESSALVGTMSAGLRGRELGRFEEAGREIRLIAQFQGMERASLVDLKDTQVFSSRGSFQRLDDLAKVRFRRTLAQIERTDGRTNLAVLGKRKDGVGPLAFSESLKRVMTRITLPRGYSWSEDSPSRRTEVQFKELLQALGLAVTLVFLVMGVLFESLILPAACLITIPFGAFGALWSLWAIHGSMDVMTIIGLVLLAGVVVNNGIVLLDCVQRLRKDGVARDVAILEATRQRLRPILMTAAITIVGLLPTILQGQASTEGISYVTMSIVVAGGLAFCTVFTAFCVPLAYLYLDDFCGWLRGAWVRGARRA